MVTARLLKAGKRSLADVLPLLSLGGDVKVGLIDYVIKKVAELSHSVLLL
jgi:hypothetical protein